MRRQCETGKIQRNNYWGGHKAGKPGKLREFEKLSKSQRNLNFYRKKPGKLRENVEYVA